MQLLVYTQQTTSRVNYIFSTLLQAAGVTGFVITNDEKFYCGFKDAKINYSSSAISEREVWIAPVSLLFEKDIKHQSIEVFLWKEQAVFYKSPGKDFPFDIFAASFYLLSRYEEYLPHSLDVYGRYAHENSLALKEGFLQLPLINLWLQELKKILQQTFPSLRLKPFAFAYLPTYDIDIAWSYLSKGWLRNAGGFVRSMVNGQWAMVKERVRVLQHQQKDPFDSYDWLDHLHKTYNMQPLYFFLLAGKSKGYDKNISPANSSYAQLIKRHARTYPTGIHPSWQSGDDNKLLKREILSLESICGKQISKSRQHYIRMKLPDTYRRLVEAGITEDYSMGYGSINGFRASYCLPYKWFDLEKNTPTSLSVYPFCYMEANSFYEQKYSSNKALEEMEHYYEVTKNVNGLLITIWHNHFLGTDEMFAGWKEVYEEFIRRHYINT
jgi:hypothetical protein